jgi:hypothetical protein
MQQAINPCAFSVIDGAEHIVAIRKVGTNDQTVAPLPDDRSDIFPELLGHPVLPLAPMGDDILDKGSGCRPEIVHGGYEAA